MKNSHSSLCNCREYVIGAFDQIGATVATQTFDVAGADRAIISTEIVSMSTYVTSYSSTVISLSYTLLIWSRSAPTITILYYSVTSDSEPYRCVFAHHGTCGCHSMTLF